MSAPLRLCMDCRWFRPQGGDRRPKCGHTSAILSGEPDLASGKLSAPVDRLFDWLGRRSWRIFILPAVVIGGGFALLLWMNQRDRAETDATFLAQCRDRQTEGRKTH
jgi:hypothetical protein